MSIPYVNLSVTDKKLLASLLEATERVLMSGQFILGKELEEFERNFAALCGVRHAMGVDNCTHALILALRALGIGQGDEVITAPNSFLASASAVVLAGARPVFCDVGGDYQLDPQKIAQAITPRTRAIIAVHLTGHPSDMDAIMAVARKHGLSVIEDAAQAIGAKYKGKPVGSLGDLACFSFHPLKNMGAPGDSGAITTNRDDLAEKIRLMRNHGLRDRDHCVQWSGNHRMDALHAAFLRVKLPYLTKWTEARRAKAALYRKGLEGVVALPVEQPWAHAVYHTFIVQCDTRDDLKAFLEKRGIGSAVHYPVPIHLQEAAKDLGYKKGAFPVTERQADRILSLPVYPELTDEQCNQVIVAIREFSKA